MELPTLATLPSLNCLECHSPQVVLPTLPSLNLECNSPQVVLPTLPRLNLERHSLHPQLQEEVNEWGGGSRYRRWTPSRAIRAA